MGNQLLKPGIYANLKDLKALKSLCYFTLGLGAIGSGWIAGTFPAQAQRRPLPPPEIYQDLPSSGSGVPIVFPENRPNSPRNTLSNTVPSLNPNGGRREYNFQAPPDLAPPRDLYRPQGSLYRVVVNSSHPDLLAQIKQVEPTAFVMRNQGMIQAGVFSTAENAQRRVQELRDFGIPSVVITPGGQGPNQPSSGRPSPELPGGYFVVIPTGRENLSLLANTVTRLGVRRPLVWQREAPRGPHVAVGPFNERSIAERLNSRLQAEGLDARVHFE